MENSEVLDEILARLRQVLGWKENPPEELEAYDAAHLLGVHPRVVEGLIRACRVKYRAGLHSWSRVVNVASLKAAIEADKGAYKPPAKPGVYVVKAGPFVKIGYTDNLRSRVSAIDTHCPHPVEVLHFLEMEQAHRLERYMHARFDSDRVKGEWFHDTAAIREFSADLVAQLGAIHER